MKADQILQSKGGDVFTIRESDTIADAVSTLNAKNIGAVVVQNSNGGVCGILSERDIVRRLGAKGGDALSMTVSECMTANPFTCTREATLDEIMAKMTDKRIRHLPVMEGDDLVGVISIGDVVKRKIEMAEQETQALKDYIAT